MHVSPDLEPGHEPTLNASSDSIENLNDRRTKHKIRELQRELTLPHLLEEILVVENATLMKLAVVVAWVAVPVLGSAAILLDAAAQESDAAETYYLSRKRVFASSSRKQPRKRGKWRPPPTLLIWRAS